VDATTWIEEFCAALGVDAPSEQERADVLSLASVAANASERMAAPICCWVAARAGRPAGEALAVARRLAMPGPAD
jgi:hypothetical protein